MLKTKKLYHWFRIIAFAEGLSFLILMGIAMPLKYFADMPMAVRVTGMIHGVLFVAFVAMAWELRSDAGKTFAWFGKAFLASIIPFGTFIADKAWKKEQAALS